jgi:hypothetical protein
MKKTTSTQQVLDTIWDEWQLLIIMHSVNSSWLSGHNLVCMLHDWILVNLPEHGSNSQLLDYKKVEHKLYKTRASRESYT